MTSQCEHSILISPVGELSTELIEAVAGEIKQVFGFSTETSPILQDLSFALDDNRNQYHSTAILDRLAANIPPHAVRVLAIAQVDLFIPILTHVYGEAQLGGAACIVSTFRLNEGRSGTEHLPKVHRSNRKRGHPRTGSYLQSTPLPGAHLHHALLPQ